MTIDLDQETQRRIEQELQSGRYKTAGEVVRDALRLMEERDHMLLLRKQEIRREIAEGLQSLRLGKGVDGEAVFDRIDAELDTLERNDSR
jgi:antitoxin ParD1/3/4